jgi:hypothetical protein
VPLDAQLGRQFGDGDDARLILYQREGFGGPGRQCLLRPPGQAALQHLRQRA